MKYAFVVFEVNNICTHGIIDWEFVGVFATEADADKACLTENHMMACITIGKGVHEKKVQEWEFGFRYPRFQEIHGRYAQGLNDYRLPEDL